MKLKWTLSLPLAAFCGFVWALGLRGTHPSIVFGVVIGYLIVLSLNSARGLAPLHGFFFGAAMNAASMPWIYTVMRVHGGLTPLPAAGAMAVLVIYLALFPMLFSSGLAILGRRGNNFAILTAPFLWVAAELLQTRVPGIAVPWMLAGYQAAGNPAFVQLASITGIYGLSFLVVTCGAAVAWAYFGAGREKAVTRRVWVGATIIVVLVVFAGFGNRWLPAIHADHEAILVQTNFPEVPSYPSNWMDLHAAEMDELEKISVDAVRQNAAGAGALKLIVWPEVPAPFYFLDPKFAARAERVARQSGAYFLAGVVEWRPGADGRLQPYNSAVMLDPSGKRVFQYDKIHLVPFGEYVPLRRWLTFAKDLVAEVGDYQPGREYSVGQLPGGKFGVGICYEAIFPNEIRQFTANGAELLVNISNDGWYGRSAAPDQHLAMARVRAVENRRWLLRGTNNGYTVAIDPYGREVARLQADVRGVLRAPFSFRSDRTIYSRFGDWFAWLCVVVALGMIVAGFTGGKEVRT